MGMDADGQRKLRPPALLRREGAGGGFGGWGQIWPLALPWGAEGGAGG